MDEKTFLFCEEAILAKQVKNSERKILYVHDVTAHHMHKTEKDSYNKIKQFVESRNYYIKKYSGYNKLQVAMVLFANKIEKIVFRVKN